MASEVDICNLALGYLGDDAIVASIDPPEGGPQAQHCATFYKMSRDETLERHAWGFATARVALVELAIEVDGWLYAYAAPNNLLKPQAVFPAGYARTDQTSEFTVEIDEATGNTIILTDAENAVLRYTHRVVDTSKFSPLFVEACAWNLAAKLAGPILKGDAGRTAKMECTKAFEYQLALATGSDANAQLVNAPATPEWISARA